MTRLNIKYELENFEIRRELIDNENPSILGQYLIEAFELRKEYLDLL